MNCLVVGGAGFIGGHLVRRLCADGHRVTVLGRPSDRLSRLRGELPSVAFYEADLERQPPPPDALARQQVVVQLVHSKLPGESNNDPEADIRTSTIPSVRLCEAARKAGVARMIYASSGGTVYGQAAELPIHEDHPTHPITSYGINKLMTEKYLLMYATLYGLEATILRIGNAYGPGQRSNRPQGAVAAFLQHVAESRPLRVWGRGDVVRDFVYIDDVIEAFSLAVGLQSTQPTHVLNIGSGQGTTIAELITELGRVTGRSCQVQWNPPRDCDVGANVLNIARAKEALGYEPRVGLSDGLARCWAAQIEGAEGVGQRQQFRRAA